MRLLQHDGVGGVSFTEDLSRDRLPPYAILSHRWGPDRDEVKFQDLMSGTATSKPGYDKIKFCIAQARKDGLRHFWIDTCCIDKTNNTELSKAINSMFHWYKNAAKCYVYLSDVPRSLPRHFKPDYRHDWEQDFRASTWFTRGWTLQELLAAESVEFFSREGERLGSKSSLEGHISDVTGISVKALRAKELSTFTVQERFSWQEYRITTEEEDRYYSLLGIMDVSMPVIYGEGAEKARRRLEREILYASKGAQPEDFCVTFSLGNVVEANNFLARRRELQKMREILISTNSRRCLVLYGLGGIGKTQLSIAYAIRYKDNYSAVFWFNSKDNDSIKSSFVRVARQIIRDHPSASPLGSVNLSNDVDAVVDGVKTWLSLPSNTHWLLVFDNYDHPKVLGIADSDAVEVCSYLPEAHQGSVIITTRSSEVGIGHGMPITKLENLQDSLSILTSSSQRSDVLQDPDAAKIAQRLDGLPLALATAGAYLRQTPAVSCADYLRHYENSWAKLQKTSPKLTAYEDRMLYSTWQISFDQIEKQSPRAAHLLQLWAYYDNQDLWFELLHHATAGDPGWLKEIIVDELDFHNHMRLLCNHGLVERDGGVEIGSDSHELESHGYSIHACVHSWTKTVLTDNWDLILAKATLSRVALHVPDISSPWWWVTSRRLLNHAAIYYRAFQKDLFLDRDIA
nr:vegetative incompatibility protein het-e-1 [Quercus suber]